MANRTTTSVAQQVKTETETPNAVQSLILMRNLIRTSLSSICYLRSLFPEDCFSDKILNGINIKALKSINDETRTLRNWLENGVFDALEKRYLRKIIFGIYQDSNLKDENMLECYSFNIAYPNEQNITLDIQNGKERTIKAQTKEEIRKATATMIRTIILLSETLKPLPQARYISMKLFYHDNVTPADYEPEFFKGALDTRETNFSKKPVAVKIGEFNTISHMLTLQIKTSPDLFEDMGDDADMQGGPTEELDQKTEDAKPPEQPKAKIPALKLKESPPSDITPASSASQKKKESPRKKHSPRKKETPTKRISPRKKDRPENETKSKKAATGIGNTKGKEVKKKDTDAGKPSNAIDPEVYQKIKEMILNKEIQPTLSIVSKSFGIESSIISQIFQALCAEGIIFQEKPYTRYKLVRCKKDRSASEESVTGKKLKGVYERALEAIQNISDLNSHTLSQELRISEPFANDILKRMEAEGVTELIKRNGRKKLIVNFDLVHALLQSQVQEKNVPDTKRKRSKVDDVENLVDLRSQASMQTQESASNVSVEQKGWKKRRTYGGDDHSPLTPVKGKGNLSVAGETPQLTDSMRNELERMMGGGENAKNRQGVKCSVPTKPIRSKDGVLVREE